jgi:hypothetical protein
MFHASCTSGAQVICNDEELGTKLDVAGSPYSLTLHAPALGNYNATWVKKSVVVTPVDNVISWDIVPLASGQSLSDLPKPTAIDDPLITLSLGEGDQLDPGVHIITLKAAPITNYKETKKTFEVVVWERYSIKGQVLFVKTEPVTGACFRVIELPSRQQVATFQAQGPDGRYEFLGLPGGKEYEVTCTLDGHLVQPKISMGGFKLLCEHQTRDFTATLTLRPNRHVQQRIALDQDPIDLLDNWCTHNPPAPTGMRRYGPGNLNTEYIFKGSGVYFHVHRDVNGLAPAQGGHLKPKALRYADGTILTGRAPRIDVATFAIYGVPNPDVAAGWGDQED